MAARLPRVCIAPCVLCMDIQRRRVRTGQRLCIRSRALWNSSFRRLYNLPYRLRKERLWPRKTTKRNTSMTLFRITLKERRIRARELSESRRTIRWFVLTWWHDLSSEHVSRQRDVGIYWSFMRRNSPRDSYLFPTSGRMGKLYKNRISKKNKRTTRRRQRSQRRQRRQSGGDYTNPTILTKEGMPVTEDAVVTMDGGKATQSLKDWMAGQEERELGLASR